MLEPLERDEERRDASFTMRLYREYILAYRACYMSQVARILDSNQLSINWHGNLSKNQCARNVRVYTCVLDIYYGV